MGHQGTDKIQGKVKDVKDVKVKVEQNYSSRTKKERETSLGQDD